jgi:hypothetical protein
MMNSKDARQLAKRDEWAAKMALRHGGAALVEHDLELALALHRFVDAVPVELLPLVLVDSRLPPHMLARAEQRLRGVPQGGLSGRRYCEVIPLTPSGEQAVPKPSKVPIHLGKGFLRMRDGMAAIASVHNYVAYAVEHDPALRGSLRRLVDILPTSLLPRVVADQELPPHMLRRAERRLRTSSPNNAIHSARENCHE